MASAVTSEIEKPVDAQAHLIRPSKFADGRTRDWSLFVFFRILSKREMKRSFDLLGSFLSEKDSGRREVLFKFLKSELAHPRRTNPSKVEAFMMKQVVKQGGEAGTSDGPSDAFLDWLKLVASAELDPIVDSIEKATKSFQGKSKAKPRIRALKDAQAEIFQDLPGILTKLASDPKKFEAILQKYAGVFAGLFSSKMDRSANIRKLLEAFGKEPAAAGMTSLKGGLPLIALYEILRQTAVASQDDVVDKNTGPAQPESITDGRLQKMKVGKGAYDSVPSNYVFTHAGLEALELDENTLRSFPDAFKEGMAARAERLGDTGPSAPEHWEGELGQDAVHGYFTGGFQVGGQGMPTREEDWKRLRGDIADFNNRTSGNGLAMRTFLNGLFRLLGMEVVHIELGQDPYRVQDQGPDGAKGNVLPEAYRMEHFGFRDGISQPFVDLKLGAPNAGGGTPGENKSWLPVAPGEILLDQKDEDNRFSLQPINDELREGSTFLVFRKLEQDVDAFRSFLAKQRPDSAPEQKKLAAQFMGRWQNGKSLVQSPDAEAYVGPENEGELNDFLYKADDPHGMKCPLSSHVRRSNPRDIGGNNDIRRHRILRRGISYGGPLLPDGSSGDGNKRGMFFICANARIDLQFEVVQTNWLNRSAFTGQSGLSKCPITGANEGGTEDQFLEAGAGVPVTRLPRFVVTKGGDYFFAPGINVLRKIASGHKFRTKAIDLPYEGKSLGDGVTPTLFEADRLAKYARAAFLPPFQPMRVGVPAAPLDSSKEESGSRDRYLDNPDINSPITFVARHADAKFVMSSKPVAGKTLFSVPQYEEAGNRLLRGGTLLVGTEETGPSAVHRQRMTAILNTAWSTLAKVGNVRQRMDAITKRELNSALARTSSTGEIDLVDDLATPVTYAIVEEVFGVPGPSYITEMAISLPFARQHVGQIYPDWLTVLDGGLPANAGQKTMQLWGTILSLDIVGNYAQMRELKALGGQAAAELLNHLDIVMANASQDIPMPPASEKDVTAMLERKRDPVTLIDVFVMLGAALPQKLGITVDQYKSDVRSILLEIVGTPMSVIPANFACVMEAVLNLRIDLPAIMPVLEGVPKFSNPKSPKIDKERDGKPYAGHYRFLYETLRLNPAVRLMMRRSNFKTKLKTVGEVQKDDWVIAILAAANLDPEVFSESNKFSLGPFDGGPARNYEDQLLYGATDGARQCWGRDTLALHVMTHCLTAASKLGGLTSLAGPNGQKREILRIPVGMKARYSELLGTMD